MNIPLPLKYKGKEEIIKLIKEENIQKLSKKVNENMVKMNQ